MVLGKVADSLWAGAGHIGLGFGPAPGQGPRALAPGPEGPWGWMLVFCVRIEVVGSLWWQERGLGLG